MNTLEIIRKYQIKFPNPNYFIGRNEISKALNTTVKMMYTAKYEQEELENKYQKSLESFGKISFLGRSNLREKDLKMALSSFQLNDTELWNMLPAIEYTDTLNLICEYFEEPFQNLKDAKKLNSLIRSMNKNAKVLKDINITPSTEDIEKLIVKKLHKRLTKQKVWDTFLYLTCVALDKNLTKHSTPSERILDIVIHLLKTYFGWSHIEDNKQPYTNRVMIGEFIQTEFYFDDFNCELLVFHSNKYDDKTKSFPKSYSSN